MTTSSEISCLFCQRWQREEQELLYEDEHCYASLDGFPVSPGHLLIIPKEHVVSWFDASLNLQQHLMGVVNQMRVWVEENYSPDGYNIGINCRESAGQTIMHLHIHLIPRYIGDMVDPRGGVRGVIPAKQSYS